MYTDGITETDKNFLDRIPGIQLYLKSHTTIRKDTVFMDNADPDGETNFLDNIANRRIRDIAC